jgi:hypothetical protein
MNVGRLSLFEPVSCDKSVYQLNEKQSLLLQIVANTYYSRISFQPVLHSL